MPALKNRKWERFARMLFEGLADGNQAWKAYVKAGYTKHEPSARADSARLLKSAPEIIERVKEFQQEAAKLAGETVEKVTNEINEIVSEARADKAHGAAISGVGLKSKILGLVVDKQEIGKPGDFTANAQTSDEIARGYLAEACSIAPEDIAEDAIEAVKSELERHHCALDAIARMPATPPAAASPEARRAATH
jgi:hypothetical protein